MSIRTPIVDRSVIDKLISRIDAALAKIEVGHMNHGMYEINSAMEEAKVELSKLDTSNAAATSSTSRAKAR